MGLFDFADSRIGVARWAAKWFREARRQNPSMPDNDIIEVALLTRYHPIPLNQQQADILHAERHMATDIYGLCHLIAEIELLSHLDMMDRMNLRKGGEGIVEHTYGVIDREIKKLGF